MLGSRGVGTRYRRIRRFRHICLRRGTAGRYKHTHCLFVVRARLSCLAGMLTPTRLLLLARSACRRLRYLRLEGGRTHRRRSRTFGPMKNANAVCPRIVLLCRKERATPWIACCARPRQVVTPSIFHCVQAKLFESSRMCCARIPRCSTTGSADHTSWEYAITVP